LLSSVAGRLTTYAYDPVGRRTGMKDPDGGFFTYQYDPAGGLDHLVNPQSERTTFGYDQADRLLVKQLANGTRTSHTYDDDGRLMQLYHYKSDNTVLDSMAYGYNKVGVRNSLVEADGAVTTWTYDEIYQLMGQERGGASGLGWATLTLEEWACPIRQPHLLFGALIRQARDFPTLEASDGEQAAGCGEGTVLA
jgi:YD repeat-containing protein